MRWFVAYSYFNCIQALAAEVAELFLLMERYTAIGVIHRT